MSEVIEMKTQVVDSSIISSRLWVRRVFVVVCDCRAITGFTLAS